MSRDSVPVPVPRHSQEQETAYPHTRTSCHVVPTQLGVCTLSLISGHNTGLTLCLHLLDSDSLGLALKPGHCD